MVLQAIAWGEGDLEAQKQRYPVLAVLQESTLRQLSK
jgi:hypothetical protein